MALDRHPLLCFVVFPARARRTRFPKRVFVVDGCFSRKAVEPKRSGCTSINSTVIADVAVSGRAYRATTNTVSTIVLARPIFTALGYY